MDFDIAPASGIYLATGGTTGSSRYVKHAWSDFEYSCQTAAESLKTLFDFLDTRIVANCMTAGSLWGGFIFVQEVLRLARVDSVPLASSPSKNDIVDNINRFGVDTIIALPSFLISLSNHLRVHSCELKTVRNVFYFGEGISESNKVIISKSLNDAKVRPLVFTTQETGPVGYHCPHLDSDTYHIFEHIRVVGTDSRYGSLEYNSFSITYPSGHKFGPHDTADVFEVKETIGAPCKCGFKGFSIRYIERKEYFANVLGTSVSAEEIVRAFKVALPEISVSKQDIQIQLVRDGSRNSVYIVVMSLPSDLDTEVLNSVALHSPLISEISDDADLFRVVSCKERDLIYSSTSGKHRFFIEV